MNFSLKTVEEEHVAKIVKKLKNKRSHGFDNISAELLKLGGDILIGPLTYIINTSILTGTFPTKWKEAKVKPLHKKEDRTLTKNYRPVSLLSVSAMVCERVIAIQIEQFFEDNKLFGSFQYGFRKNKSTISELLTLFDNLLAAKEKGLEIALILYDLSAAFDTVDPEILLSKLRLYGFNDMAMQWIRSYLTGRKQAVMVEEEVSDMTDIEIGTPQGSRLSPLLFVIIMADLEAWIENSSLTNFADDTQSIIIAKSESTLIETAQKEANEVIRFFSGVNLVNNSDKACLLTNSAGKEKNMEMQDIGGENLQSKSSEKLLGLQISGNLDWKTHINKLCSTLKQRLGLLKRIKYKISQDKLQVVAEAIFNSKIRYGLAVYGRPRLDEEEPEGKDMHKLQVLQNDMI